MGCQINYFFCSDTNSFSCKQFNIIIVISQLTNFNIVFNQFILRSRTSASVTSCAQLFVELNEYITLASAITDSLSPNTVDFTLLNFRYVKINSYWNNNVSNCS
ncbi:hypothetical protein D3C77_575840 [compost metagenome]